MIAGMQELIAGRKVIPRCNYSSSGPRSTLWYALEIAAIDDCSASVSTFVLAARHDSSGLKQPELLTVVMEVRFEGPLLLASRFYESSPRMLGEFQLFTLSMAPR